MYYFIKLFHKIKRLGRLVKFFFNANWVWRAPPHCDVLIYDQAGSAEIKLLFDAGCKVDVLSLRGESFNVSVLIGSLSVSGQWIKNISRAYVVNYIKKTRAKLVITFIDNSRYFYTISKDVPSIKTAFIQNGIRGSVRDVFRDITAASSYRVDYMFVFGVDIGKQYSKFIEGNPVPIGSVKNNMLTTPKIANLGSKKRLAYLSQWRPKVLDGVVLKTKDHNITHDDYYFSETLIVPFLNEWCEDNGYLFAIIGFAQEKLEADQEYDFYKDLIKSEYVFLSSGEMLGSYHQLDQFDLIAFIESTLGYESLARGKKTAAFTIRGSLLGTGSGHFGWPGCYDDTGPFWTNRVEFSEFKKILDYLRDVSDVEWESVRSAVMKNIMLYDPDNKVIKDYFREILEHSENK